MIPKENLRIGDRIKAYMLRIDRNARGPQIILSRTAPEFVIKLFRAGSAGDFRRPDGTGRLVPVTRVCAPRLPSKSNDPRVDPIGTCVGLRGCASLPCVTKSVARTSTSCCGRPIRPSSFIGALSPAEVSSIVVDEESTPWMWWWTDNLRHRHRSRARTFVWPRADAMDHQPDDPGRVS